MVGIKVQVGDGCADLIRQFLIVPQIFLFSLLFLKYFCFPFSFFLVGGFVVVDKKKCVISFLLGNILSFRYQVILILIFSLLKNTHFCPSNRHSDCKNKEMQQVCSLTCTPSHPWGVVAIVPKQQILATPPKVHLTFSI